MIGPVHYNHIRIVLSTALLAGRIRCWQGVLAWVLTETLEQISANYASQTSSLSNVMFTTDKIVVFYMFADFVRQLLPRVRATQWFVWIITNLDD